MEGLNDIDGVTCLPSDGAMYAFPRVELPPKALDEAASHEQTPDSLYALSLLEETGEYHTTLVSFNLNFDCLLIPVPFPINLICQEFVLSQRVDSDKKREGLDSGLHSFLLRMN